MLRTHAQPEPRRTAVATDLASFGALFEERERRPQSRAERRAIDAEQLLLRIVQIVQIDRLKPEVGAALRDLVTEKGRRDRVSPAHEVVASDDARPDERLIQPDLVVLARCGRRAVQGDVAALRTNHQFVAPRFASGDHRFERAADHTLRSLTAIIARRIDQIHAVGDRGAQRLRVAHVVRVGAIAQVRADTERADGETPGKHAAEIDPAISVAFGEPASARAGGARRVACRATTRSNGRDLGGSAFCRKARRAIFHVPVTLGTPFALGKGADHGRYSRCGVTTRRGWRGDVVYDVSPTCGVAGRHTLHH